ncbi:MAG: tRNA (adenosine(37)-N6)-threonylcarbamoyltransferase complex dimerization subunit type 1 TsaB [Bacteroidia bacterium]|nr:tRNA (adenosine(37)-N6)-threonylcarbamoyltransferase complex dimerization subunit type 1 TsaB [Bacteroidia bacterium]
MVAILCIETSGEACSIAVFNRDKLIAKAERFEKNIHASAITLLIQEALLQAGLALNQLQAVSVSKGPGSYTGLRVGVSTAKGLCYALKIPLIAIPTLHAMAWGYKTENRINPDALVCPMIDARRMEVYTEVMNRELQTLMETKAEVLTEESFKAFHHKTIHFAGSGAFKMQQFAGLFTNITINQTFLPSAIHMGTLTWHAFEAGHFENIAYFEPFYLKDFVGTQPKRNT